MGRTLIALVSLLIPLQTFAARQPETPLPEHRRPAADGQTPGCKPVQDGPVTVWGTGSDGVRSNFGGRDIKDTSDKSRERCKEMLEVTRRYCQQEMGLVGISSHFVNQTYNPNSVNAIRELEAAATNLRNKWNDCGVAYANSSQLCLGMYVKTDMALGEYQQKLARPENCEIGEMKQESVSRNLDEAKKLHTEAIRIYYEEGRKYDESIAAIEKSINDLSAIRRTTSGTAP